MQQIISSILEQQHMHNKSMNYSAEVKYVACADFFTPIFWKFQNSSLCACAILSFLFGGFRVLLIRGIMFKKTRNFRNYAFY